MYTVWHTWFGSGDNMMSSTARWALKILAISAIINCSAQEYETPSTTNDEWDQCEKEDGGYQNNTTSSVEYSREGSNADGANPSEAVLESGPVMSPSGNTRPRPFGPVMSPSGNTRPRPFEPVLSSSGNTRPRSFGPVMSPSGTPGLGITMRVRTHGFSRCVPVAHWRKTARSCI